MPFRLIAVLIVVFGVSAQAAEIEILQEKKLPYAEIAKGECTIRLTGVIEPGDAEKLEKVVQSRFDSKTSPTHGDSLCLDGPGGSLDAAVTMAMRLRASSVSAIVPPNASCLSACAVVFMGGSSRQNRIAKNARFMFATSRVGFHAPSLEVQNGSYDKETVAKAFDVAVSALGRIAIQLSRPEWAETTVKFPYSLLGAMLDYRGQNFLMIELVEHAGVWDIEVIGLRSAKPTERSLKNLCDNALRWVKDQPSLEWRSLNRLSAEPLTNRVEQIEDQRWSASTPDWIGVKCDIKRLEQGDYKVSVEVKGTIVGVGDYRSWAAFPPNKMLIDLTQ